MILGICENVDVLKVINIVVTILKIIQIVVPIVLMFSLMFKMINAMTKKDDDAIASLKKKAVPNIVAAVLIFIVPLLVGIIMNVTLPDSEYTKCIVGISSEKLQQAYEDKAEKLVSKAEETLNINDYINAKNYMPNVKDKDKRSSYEERLEAVKALIDENRKTSPYGESTGLGSDIVASAELQEACTWIFNQEDVKIRLLTCNDEEYRYDNPEKELPGGALILSNGIAKAKDPLPLSEYQKGVFFGEQKIKISADSRYAFMLIYKTSFLHNAVRDAIRDNETYGSGKEIFYYAGSCSQNYRTSLRRMYYDSGKYKEEIDDTVENTKYFVIANADGTLTNAHYHAFTGIEQAIEKAGNEGKDFIEIIEKVIGKGNTDSIYYTTARVYDCRNLVDGGNTDVDITNIKSNIIYTGDSRTSAYRGIKSQLGFDDKKESIYAKAGTTANDYFQTHLKQAKNELDDNPNIYYAVTANYGTNDLHNKNKYCNGYKSFVSNMSSNNQFYIISVTPVDDNKNPWHKNTDVTSFNNYMQNTCIPEIKSNNSGKEVYFCDIYNKLSIDEWMDFISASDKYGEHYNDEGYKFIYNEIKKCIAAHQ